MRVALFGGTGFVGGYLIDELLAQGHHPVVLVRPGSEGRLREPARCTPVSGDVSGVQAVSATLEGCDAAIYNIGILREVPVRGITYQALHFEGAKRAMDLAGEVGVPRFLLMSANGVKAEGTAYQRTKYMAEQYLETTDLEWTIFRPSVIFGDPRGRMEFATQLYQEVIRPPMPAPLFFDGLVPMDAGGFQMSPVHVRDVATAFIKSLALPETIGRIVPLCGPDALSWRAILETIATAVGTQKLMVPAPAWGVKAAATLLDQFAFFPVTRDQITMLMEGNTCDSRDIFGTLGIDPVAFTSDSLSYLQFTEVE
jgi:NADH dehydrogenase